MRRVLITGGTGFVGQHVVPYLAARGFQVTVATRQSSNIAGAQTVTVGDLRNDIDWSRYLDGMDAVIHLAALAHITSKIPDSDYDEINRRALVPLARAAKSNCARLIFASSVAAQSGPTAELPLTESDNPAPTTLYGRSKLHAEQEIRDTLGEFVILRPTLIYGAGVIGNMQRLMRLALSRVPPPFKLVNNRRSLLAVENMCDAIYFVLHSKQALNRTFLLADREPIATRDMITQLRLGAGLSTKQIPVPPAVLRGTLQLLRRGDMWDKLAGDLVVSVAGLEAIGFKWRLGTRDGLYALGGLSRNRHAQYREHNSLSKRAFIEK